MGLFQRLFKKKVQGQKKEISSENWEEPSYSREELDLRDDEQRGDFFHSCIEQIEEASMEVEHLSREYAMVTSYLTDIDELEGFPEETMEQLKDTATKLVYLEKDRETFLNRKDRLDDAEYARLEQMEEELESGVEKLDETENMRKLIKKDLKRLAEEKHAWRYQVTEQEDNLEKYKGISIACFIIMGVCYAITLGLQIFLEMDGKLGYVLTTVLGAGIIIILFARYREAESEHTRAVKMVNRVITLQNTVKIRYINNKRLLDYYYLKYNVRSAKQLEEEWALFRTEKKDRQAFEEASRDFGFYQKDLLRILRCSRIKDPSVWLHQTRAILDKKEMVEIRHELNVRRQKIRERMEECRNIAEEAKNELKAISAEHPEYTTEILQMIDKVGKEEEM